MHTDRSERSLSPLGKDPLSVGKLFKSKRNDQSNPEMFSTTSLSKNQSELRDRSPKNVGINTSRIILPIGKYQINQNQVKPVTHFKVGKQDGGMGEKKGLDLRSSCQEPKLRNRRKLGMKNQGDIVPAVVDFPNSYEYDENDDLPETPDLPNRTTQTTKTQTQTSPLKLKTPIQQKPQPGIIKHQQKSRLFTNSAPKDLHTSSSPNQTSQSFQISSPQLPYIHKIDNNINGFYKFINEPTQYTLSSNQNKSSSTNFKNLSEVVKKYRLNNNKSTNGTYHDGNVAANFNSSYMRRKSLTKNIGEIVKKGEKSDPEEEDKLEQRKNFRISNNNFHTSRIKLPTFREENKEEFEQQVDLERSYHLPSGIKNSSQNLELNKVKSNIQKLAMSSSTPPSYSYPEQQPEPSLPGTLFSTSFLKPSPHPNPSTTLSISLRTSIQKLKQTLIQSSQSLYLQFNLPQIFFHPPTGSSTSQQLHNMMLQIFTHIGITPQIVSIKKFINCVVMRDKKLCVLWNFNGKVYFGGWRKADGVGEGVKDGVGIQWVPSSIYNDILGYVYYGEFKDNKKEGYGLMKKSSRQVYVGCWKNNMRWGWGKVYDADGNLHQNGEFIEGCFIYPQKGYKQATINSQDRNN